MFENVSKIARSNREKRRFCHYSDTLLAGKRAAQPRAREAQLVPDYMDGAAHCQCHFLRRHAAEVVHLQQFGEPAMFAFESFEGAVQVQQLELIGTTPVAPDLDSGVQRQARLAAAALLGGRRSRAWSTSTWRITRDMSARKCARSSTSGWASSNSLMKASLTSAVGCSVCPGRWRRMYACAIRRSSR
jgi:hypothetical protein